MATYSIKEDENFPWVNLITINSNRDIDISNEVFNITVKDQLEYFVADHIKEGSTFELEELFKKDTYPTLEISNNSTVYEQQNCFTCNGTHRVVCSACGGKGYYYTPLAKTRTICSSCGPGPDDPAIPWIGTKGSGYYDCPDCTDGHAYTVCEPVRPMYTEVYKSNVSGYNNSDYDSLVHNGIQFWVDGVNKKTMYIRVVSKGKSTTNSAGYIQWNPVSAAYYPVGYVGFTIANFNITLNNYERLVFNSFNLPKVVMGTPVPDSDEYNPDTISSYAELTGHIISGAIRTNYDWNDDYHGIDNLFVNYTTEDKAGNSTNEYTQYPVDDDTYSANWKTLVTTARPNYLQRKYIVKSSAYLTDYLVNGSAFDLYESVPEEECVTATRGFEFTNSSVKSYLYDEYTHKKLKLPFTMNTLPVIPSAHFLESNGEYVYDDLYCYEIIQSIEDSSCSGKIRKNQVKLELEI